MDAVLDAGPRCLLVSAAWTLSLASAAWTLSLASAFCFRFASVAPVRGGTYFSLPRQRKVGKRKPLTPPVLVLACGPPTVLTLHAATRSFARVASVLTARITHFKLPRHGPRYQEAHGRPGGKLCVGRRDGSAPLRTEKRDRCRRSTNACSAIAYTQFATWAALTSRCCWPPAGDWSG